MQSRYANATHGKPIKMQEHTMLDLTKINTRFLRDTEQTLDDNTQTQHLTAHEFIDRYLTYNGIIGYTDKIIDLVQQAYAAEVLPIRTRAQWANNFVGTTQRVNGGTDEMRVFGWHESKTGSGVWLEFTDPTTGTEYGETYRAYPKNLTE